MSARKQFSILFYVIILLHACFVRISSFPHKSANNDDAGIDGGDMEIITVEEIVRDSKANFAKNSSDAALITPNNATGATTATRTTMAMMKKSSSEETSSSAQNDASNEPLIDTADDLIFLAERLQPHSESEEVAQNRQQQQQQQKALPSTTLGTFQQIDLLTSAEEDSLTAISTSVASKSSEEQTNTAKADINDGKTTAAPIKHVIAVSAAGAVVENDDDVDDDEVAIDSNANSSLDDADDDDVNSSGAAVVVSTSVRPIDMSDFVALIPVGAVKSIATNYYRNDPDVQRAYAYLNSPDFVVVRQHIIVLPEVHAFLRYLNNSGLDVVGFLYTLTNLTRKPDELIHEDNITDDIGSGNDAVIGNEIENGIKLNQLSTTSGQLFEGTTTGNGEEPVKGLQGLVDSVLEVLPQDQILATFFDKLESNEQFTRLVDNIGQPAFARILHNLQNSAQLRTLVFTLHNHGIYVTRIIDSLKAYFFLGTF